MYVCKSIYLCLFGFKNHFRNAHNEAENNSVLILPQFHFLRCHIKAIRKLLKMVGRVANFASVKVGC